MQLAGSSGATKYPMSHKHWFASVDPSNKVDVDGGQGEQAVSSAQPVSGRKVPRGQGVGDNDLSKQ